MQRKNKSLCLVLDTSDHQLKGCYNRYCAASTKVIRPVKKSYYNNLIKVSTK